MLKRVLAFTFFAVLCAATALFGQANGRLQIHFMDVGQGDGILLISPKGQTVLFDAGQDMKRKDCTRPVSYLDQLGVRQIDQLIVSHYHSDHIGCIPEVLQQFPLQGDALDRGKQYPGTFYTNYVKSVAGHRKTATVGQTIQLDAGSSNPVVLKVVAMNGAGISTSNENDLSVAVTVAFGRFRAEIGGDLSGESKQGYKDIESTVAPDVGRIDVYKVHHHCSAHSTNDTWLEKTTPTIGIISVGDGNDYGHPTEGCLERLHAKGVKTYWTETGHGIQPEPGLDFVGGSTVVEVAPAATTFSVSTSGGQLHTYGIAASGQQPPPPDLPTFVWSGKSKSQVYHHPNCDSVQAISAANKRTGSSPPDGWTLHKGCPVIRRQ